MICPTIQALLMIQKAVVSDYAQIIEVWERSVRATHYFLKEEDIQFFKPLILNQYLDAVRLFCTRNTNNDITGFLGLSDDKIEMLFIDPVVHGQGLGKELVNFAIHQHGIRKVDVNEQNEQAVGFYKHLGFQVVNRTPLDSMGKPFPILSMEIDLSTAI